MTDLMVIAVVLVIVGAATAYIMKAKKRGVKCIGCPLAGECAKKQSSDSKSGCSCGEKSGYKQ